MLVNYVDLDGDPVSIETVKRGILLTVENQRQERDGEERKTFQTGVAVLTPDQARWIAEALLKAKSEMERDQ